MKDRVREVLEVVAQGPGSLTKWMEAHPDQVTPELATAIRDVFGEALNDRDAGLASAAARYCSPF